jgi:prolyl-tRNA editing enzyme YbaK/EbsC (Cys-tRNA(Pro) deacylase)
VYSRVEPPPFPFAGAERVVVEQRLLTAEIVWLEAGSPRHVLGLDPGVLLQVTRAIPADVTQEG